MFGRKSKPSSSILQFKDGVSMFEAQCKFGQVDLRKGKGNLAIVTKAWTQPNAKTPCQNTMLRVADQDGGFIVISETPSMRGDLLQEGDIVIWVPEAHASASAEALKDIRSGWIGFVRAKLALEYDPSAKSPYRTVCRY